MPAIPLLPAEVAIGGREFLTICAGDSISEDNEQNRVQDRLDFILTHLQEPIFPRNIMTKALGYQKEAFNVQ